MENSMQKHIQNEADLNYYEDYLKENFCDNSTNEEIANTRENQPMRIENRKSAMPCRNAPAPRVLTSDIFSNGYLQKHQGKLVKVESMIGNLLDCKVGILLDVGADYIAIKLNRGCLSMMIPTSNIKYITIIHDNDVSKIFN